MRRLLIRLLWLGLGFVPGLRLLAPSTPAQPAESVARIHFAGFDRVNDDAQAGTLKEIWRLPETARLRESVLQKLARAMAGHFRARQENPKQTDCAALLQPLLEDLLRRESYAEVKRQGPRGHLCTLAIQLDADRRRIWETNCSQLSTQWSRVTKTGTNRIAFASSEAWFLLIAHSGAAKSDAAEAESLSFIREVKAKGRPGPAFEGPWLKADLDMGRLSHKLPFVADADQPRVEFTASGKAGRLISQARLTFPQAMGWQIEKWQVPANTIRDPQGRLMSFVGVQGIARWLNRQPFMQKLRLDPIPNQAFVWGDSHAPLQLLAAVPVRDVTNFLTRFDAELRTNWNTVLRETDAGEVQFLTNDFRLMWVGLAPGIFPYLRPAPESAPQFLQAGLFPLRDAATNPPPSDLLDQFARRTNLLYYDWEITQERLTQLRTLIPFLSYILDLHNPDAASPSFKWLDAIEPKLGNSVTEITADSPRELKLVRNSQLGLNGLELMALAYWFESPNFPRVNFEVSLRTASKPRKQASLP
ncbi:MAG: hypothetical protein HY735_14480 [Verrucomicrobia bacterium]|nr:hypothetical protein [Verrucomicrobiota bacterium]